MQRRQKLQMISIPQFCRGGGSIRFTCAADRPCYLGHAQWPRQPNGFSMIYLCRLLQETGDTKKNNLFERRLTLFGIGGVLSQVQTNHPFNEFNSNPIGKATTIITMSPHVCSHCISLAAGQSLHMTRISLSPNKKIGSLLVTPLAASSL